MDTNHIYEKIMIEYYFNEVKFLRNRWGMHSSDKKSGLATIIDIEGKDHKEYSFIMKRTTDIIFEMLADVIIALLKEYEIPVTYYDVRCQDTRSYYVSEDKDWIDYNHQDTEKKVLAFSRNDKNKKILFVF